MAQNTPDPKPDDLAPLDLGAVAEELKREAERLQRLAADLKAREESLAEMQGNYPHFKRLVYEQLRKWAEDQPPLPDDVDLETWTMEQGALPLEVFIKEIEALDKKE